MSEDHWIHCGTVKKGAPWCGPVQVCALQQGHGSGHQYLLIPEWFCWFCGRPVVAGLDSRLADHARAHTKKAERAALLYIQRMNPLNQKSAAEFAERVLAGEIDLEGP